MVIVGQQISIIVKKVNIKVKKGFNNNFIPLYSCIVLCFNNAMQNSLGGEMRNYLRF